MLYSCPVNTKLYVGNLSWNVGDDQLKQAFAQVGNVVSARVMVDKMTGRSRGFGFVEMSSEEEVNAAIAMWNGKDLDGRKLVVNVAKPMEERRPTSGGNY